MHPDPETLQEWNDNYKNAPSTKIKPGLRALAEGQSSLSLMAKSPWNTSNIYQRNQIGCGDCWVWTNTAAAEIALSASQNITQRLSVQAFNSCWLNGKKRACCGGDPTTFANFYTAMQQYMLPWLNANAKFADGFVSPCDTSSLACSAIGASPQYIVTSMTASRVETANQTSGVPAVNIKAVLANNQAVTYAMTLATKAAWDAFYDFWDNQDETAVFDPGQYSGQTYGSDGGGGGHEMLIVGYIDLDATHRYWVVLNSWGGSTNRPNGVWLLNMETNYDAYYVDKSGNNQNMQGFWTIDVAFSIPTDVGSLDVTLQPASAVDRGAKWQVDGGGWQAGGTTMAGLSPGSHTVSFSSISGYTTPASQTVTVSQGATTSATAAYALGMNAGAVLTPLDVPTVTDVPGFNAGFAEQFTDASALDHWTQNSFAAWSVTNGYASVTGTSSGNYFNLAYADKDFSTLDYSVRIRRTGKNADADFNAIYFRGTSTPQDSYGDWNAGYWFAYSNNGYFTIYKAQNAAWTCLVNQTQTSAIVPIDWNVLRVTASGSSLQFFINGTSVYSLTDATLSSGQVGIEMSDADGGTLDVASAMLSTALPAGASSAGADQPGPSPATPQGKPGTAQAR
ncbi:family 16 glycoside hydrolase [Desulfovibrio sp. TomC]|uniref:family 16 glycoside hydrolase n=1 Tax=Desulfovibrio sp. TomC TaxID=1562888 RepID=UPI000574D5CC|nr:family 16 glycoside hydrolase [Desulfovibrio sp. TomC]KHK00513.1 cell surface protein [Desulfovibrio sp. TomC]